MEKCSKAWWISHHINVNVFSTPIGYVYVRLYVDNIIIIVRNSDNIKEILECTNIFNKTTSMWGCLHSVKCGNPYMLGKLFYLVRFQIHRRIGNVDSICALCVTCLEATFVYENVGALNLWRNNISWGIITSHKFCEV